MYVKGRLMILRWNNEKKIIIEDKSYLWNNLKIWGNVIIKWMIKCWWWLLVDVKIVMFWWLKIEWFIIFCFMINLNGKINILYDGIVRDKIKIFKVNLISDGEEILYIILKWMLDIWNLKCWKRVYLI